MDATMKHDRKSHISIGIELFIFAAIILLLPRAIASAEPFHSPKDAAIKRLKEAGVSDHLIALLNETHLPEERDRIVEMNVLGFLGKADYSGHYSERAIRKCLEFIKRYRRKLRRIELTYGVSQEVVAALLWMETKHGTKTGGNSVPHVYFSLLQANHPEVMKATLSALSTRAPASIEDHKQKVIDRSYAKANWALREIQSLDAIQKLRSKDDIKNLSGSYAGAFGIPQFIPSSYLQWARPKSKSRPPNLFAMEDAIHSVGFYLKANGWKPKDPNSQRQALYHYNRADGYVEVILRIASEIRGKNSLGKAPK